MVAAAVVVVDMQSWMGNRSDSSLVDPTRRNFLAASNLREVPPTTAKERAE